MPRLGYFLATEEHPPHELLRQARLAQEAGFDSLWISDHFHPWVDAQGESPFVWSVIGAIGASVPLPITTAVTCPIMRIHPAVIAQAAATSAVMAGGGFTLGVGSGEALNEHIFGDPWPSAPKRQDMLQEAIEVMRELWTGRMVNHSGTYFEVESARLYTLPEQAPRVFVSAFGRRAAELAGSTGDGLIIMGPESETIRIFRDSGGAGKPVQAGLKVCWGPDEAQARAVAHRRWPNVALAGEAPQLLPLPRHFEQLTGALVTEEQVAATIPCGPDPQRHLDAIRPYFEAGVDEVYVSQVGHDQVGFFDFYASEVIPRMQAQSQGVPVGG